MFATLCGEPFYITPRDYAELTDFQIGVMVRVAVKRAEEAKRQAKGLPPRIKATPPKEGELTRDKFIQLGLGMFGGSAEVWGRQWDAQEAAAKESVTDAPS